MNILFLLQAKRPKHMEVSQKHIQEIKNISPDVRVTVVLTDRTKEVTEDLKKTDILISSADLPEINAKTAPHLTWIHVTIAGVNKLPEYVKQSGIVVTNSSGVHPIPIAEHVFGFMVMFARQLHNAYKIQLQEKKWDRSFNRYPTTELYGKTIGIIGMGRIGKRIAHLAKSLDMNVVGVTKSPHQKDQDVDEQFTVDKLDQIISKMDYVVSCLPETKDTYHLFDKKIISKIKPTAYFINIGRGSVVDEKQLIHALKTKKIAGAGLDVFEEEPLPSSSPLWNLDNVLITSHYAGWTPEYMNRVIEIFCENLKAHIENKPMPNLVDITRGY